MNTGSMDSYPFASLNLYNDSSGFWESPLATIQLSDEHPPSMENAVTEATNVGITTKSATQPFTLVETFWILLFGTMLSISICGNLIVIWIISCHRRMRSVTNFFLLNLAVADLAVSWDYYWLNT